MVQKNDIEKAKKDEATPDNNGTTPKVSAFKTLNAKLSPKENIAINNTKFCNVYCANIPTNNKPPVPTAIIPKPVFKIFIHFTLLIIKVTKNTPTILIKNTNA